MQIKLLVSRSGVGFSQTAGEIIEVPEGEGKRMVDAGQAVETGKKEKAAKPKTYEKANKK